jgi:ElaB/YqjD/DUF883 family membrane-anchored ribosome-binding protein
METLLERLLEQDFGDTFRPISDEGMISRVTELIKEMGINEVLELAVEHKNKESVQKFIRSNLTDKILLTWLKEKFASEKPRWVDISIFLDTLGKLDFYGADLHDKVKKVISISDAQMIKWLEFSEKQPYRLSAIRFHKNLQNLNLLTSEVERVYNSWDGEQIDRFKEVRSKIPELLNAYDTVREEVDQQQNKLDEVKKKQIQIWKELIELYGMIPTSMLPGGGFQTGNPAVYVPDNLKHAYEQTEGD